MVPRHDDEVVALDSVEIGLRLRELLLEPERRQVARANDEVGAESLISPIARSMRLGMKCGPPQWMSEMCAIWNVRSAAGMVEVYVRPKPEAYPNPLLSS